MDQLASTIIRSCLARDGHDRLSRRQERGIEIAASLALRTSGKRGGWKVSSQSRDDEEYYVRGGYCDCPDERDCKHLFAVECVRILADELTLRLGRDRWSGDVEDVREMLDDYRVLVESAAHYRPPADDLLYAFRLEAIGDDAFAGRAMCARAGRTIFTTKIHQLSAERPWVARITGLCPQYEFARDFQHGQKDYREANRTGSRGVWLYYHLPPGLYEIKELISHQKCRRYFARVADLKMEEIEKGDVLEWLANRLS